MKLMHYTADPLTFDPDRTYNQHEPHAYGKPTGFWVSVEGEDDWPTWCRSEGFHLGALTHAHQVTLQPDAHILHMSSGAELEQFHDTYAAPSDFDLTPRTYGGLKDFWGINWGPVADEYDGIIIAPYLWSHRLDSRANWYYGFDCASGCIWNLDAIADVTELAAHT